MFNKESIFIWEAFFSCNIFPEISIQHRCAKVETFSGDLEEFLSESMCQIEQDIDHHKYLSKISLC